MKMYLHLLAAALLIAPACAFGMETAPAKELPPTPTAAPAASAPVVVPTTAPAPAADPAKLEDAPAAPSSTALPTQPAEQQQPAAPAPVDPANATNPAPAVVPPVLQPAIPQVPSIKMPEWEEPAAPGKTMRALNWLRNFIYPAVTVTRYNMKKCDPLTENRLFDEVDTIANKQHDIKIASWSLGRRRAMLGFMELGALAFILKYCTPILNRTNGLKTAGALLGGFVASRLMLGANQWWNQRFVRGYESEMKKSGQVTLELVDHMKSTFASFNKRPDKIEILNAMTTAKKAA